MIDLAEIWRSLEDNLQKPHGLIWPADIQKHAELFSEILRPAQIQLEKFDYEEPKFVFHPRPDIASSKSWVWVLAVRHGAFAYAFQRREAMKFPQRELADDERVQRFIIMDQIIKYFHENASHRARTEVFCGPEIIEMVALSPDCTRVLARFLGASPVLGFPSHPELWQGKIRLFRNVTEWLKNLCAGIVLIGEPHENLHYLQNCENGIITDSIAHGTQIKKMLMRPYAGPQILVAA